MQRHLVDEADHLYSLIEKRRAEARLLHNFLNLCGDDIHYSAATLGAKVNRPSSQGKQGVILASTDICAWVKVGASLTHDDLTGANNLARVTLYPESLRV
jgi:hypothetical protein